MEQQVLCGNPDHVAAYPNTEFYHESALHVKACFAESHAKNSDDPSAFRKFLGEEDYWAYVDDQNWYPLEY